MGRPDPLLPWGGVQGVAGELGPLNPHPLGTGWIKAARSGVGVES